MVIVMVMAIVMVTVIINIAIVTAIVIVIVIVWYSTVQYSTAYLPSFHNKILLSRAPVPPRANALVNMALLIY